MLLNHNKLFPSFISLISTRQIFASFSSLIVGVCLYLHFFFTCKKCIQCAHDYNVKFPYEYWLSMEVVNGTNTNEMRATQQRKRKNTMIGAWRIVWEIMKFNTSKRVCLCLTLRNTKKKQSSRLELESKPNKGNHREFPKWKPHSMTI